jgi:cytochrome c556
MIRIGLAVGAIAVGVTIAVAQTNVVVERSNLMKTQGQHTYRVLNGMVKGEAPYDQAKVDEAFVKLAETAPKISGLYPESSKGQSAPESQYIASAKIWDNKADFDARVAKLTKDIGDIRGKIKNLDDLKANYPALSSNCSGCHDQYRVRKS